MIHKSYLKDQRRIEKLCLFGEYLCGLECPYIKYDVRNECYKPIYKPNGQPDILDSSVIEQSATHRTFSTSSNCTNISNDFERDNQLPDMDSMTEALHLDDDLLELKGNLIIRMHRNSNRWRISFE